MVLIRHHDELFIVAKNVDTKRKRKKGSTEVIFRGQSWTVNINSNKFIQQQPEHEDIYIAEHLILLYTHVGASARGTVLPRSFFIIIKYVS